MKMAVSVSLLLVLAAFQCSGQLSPLPQFSQEPRKPQDYPHGAQGSSVRQQRWPQNSQEPRNPQDYPHGAQGSSVRQQSLSQHSQEPRNPQDYPQGAQGSRDPQQRNSAQAFSRPQQNAAVSSSSTPKPWATPEPAPQKYYTTSNSQPTRPQIDPTHLQPTRPVQTKAPFSLIAASSKLAARPKTKTSSKANSNAGATSPPRPNPTGDKILYDHPGANLENTTINGLALSGDEISPDSAMDINSGLRQFALDLLMEMSSVSPGKNVVMSPYSIWAVMLVIYEGAVGQTATQIANTLMFKDKKKNVRANYKRLEIALRKANAESQSDFVSGNGIFFDVNRPPKPMFERSVQNDFQCSMLPVDFSKPAKAVTIINQWVANVTRDRIKMLVKSDDIGLPELIITNALFFKGQWKIPFNRTATHKEKFYNEQKEQIGEVQMMYQKGEYMYSYISEIGAHVLDMPYQDSKFRMLVVLPKPASTVDDVLKLMKQFPVDLCYERLVKEQEMFSEDEVHVYLPRFKFRNRMELSPNLRNMGIVDVFNSNKANLSAMSEAPLFLGKVFHVSEIEVNEEGTIASAATAGAFVNKMGPPKFMANRPFAYFIVENSLKTVIFAGKVVNPNVSS